MLTSFKEWFRVSSKGELLEAQRELLLYSIPYFDQANDSGNNATVSQTYLDDKVYLNELAINNFGPSEKADEALLMIHGYGAGLGFFCRNYNSLADVKNKNIAIYSIDLLGHSLSSRTKFEFADKNFKSPKIKLHYSDNTESAVKSADDEAAYVQETVKAPVQNEKNIESFDYENLAKELLKLADATSEVVKNYENYYVESIESWRKRKDIAKINLLGHSFGAYLTVSYALKYPEHVNKLILVSPVGVERSVFAISSMKYHGLHNITKDIKPSEDRTSVDHIGRILRVPSFFIRLWDSGIMPFPVLRGMGPLGVYAASKFTTSRYVEGSRDAKEVTLLSNYALASFWKQSSTEKSISRILSPIVTARDPVMDKLDRFKVGPLQGQFPKTMWLYGDKDWMDVKAGKIASDTINSQKLGGPSSFELVHDSGHNLFLDNPQRFNQLVKQFLDWR